MAAKRTGDDGRLPEVAQSDALFKWTAIKEQAAELLAAGEITDQQIANNIHVARRTLGGWKQRPEFQARVDQYIAEYRAAIRSRGIAVMENRVGHLQRRHDLMNKVISERAADLTHARVPGWTTGLIVKDTKVAGPSTVDVFAVDTALLKELRETEKQAAQELGQWAEKVEHGGKVLTATLTRADLSEMTDDELLKFERAFARRSGGTGETGSP